MDQLRLAVGRIWTLGAASYEARNPDKRAGSANIALGISTTTTTELHGDTDDGDVR